MRLSVLAFAIFAGAACTPEAEHAAAPAADAPCRTVAFEGDGFTVCAFDPKQHELRLVTAAADGVNLRGLSALRASLGGEAARVRFAMNAGMFDAQGSAIGLSVEAGVERHAVNTQSGPGNFHMQPNGVFSVDDKGAPHVDTTDDFIRRGAAIEWATQSGPMLVIAGALHPQIQFDGQSLNIRNGVGVRDDGVTFFVISDSDVSFGKIARLFRDTLDCQNALYLDGVVSSLWVPSLKRLDARAPLGPMVVVLDR